MPWRIRWDGLTTIIQDFLTIDDEDAVTRQEIPYFFAQTQRMDGYSIRVHERFEARLALEILFAQRVNPGRLLLGLKLATHEL